jgi:hypothetical protein
MNQHRKLAVLSAESVSRKGSSAMLHQENTSAFPRQGSRYQQNGTARDLADYFEFAGRSRLSGVRQAVDT